MATANITAISSPPPTLRAGIHDARLAASMDRSLLVFSAVERLSVLSSDIFDAVQEGESYERLTRQLLVLHENLQEVSMLAASARLEKLPPIVAAESLASITVSDGR